MQDHWTEKYIDALRETGLEGRARTEARVPRSLVETRYRNDPEFQDAVDDALDKWADKLEAEAFRRGVEGIDKGVYYQGEKVDTEKQYSDSLLSRMLEARRKGYGKEVKITGAGAGGALVVNVRRFDEQGNPVNINPHDQATQTAAAVATGAALADSIAVEDLA